MRPAESPVDAIAVSGNCSWTTAYRLAYDVAVPLPFQTVPLAQAMGCTLAEDLNALQDMPHYDSSAMDGWAVAGPPPWRVLDVAPVPGSAHKARVDRLEAGEAVAILTGGAIPAGTAGILRSEYGSLSTDGDRQILLPNERARSDPKSSGGAPAPGQHIRRAGEEARAGERMIAAGTRLNPAHVALAAIAGHDMVPVWRAPRVSLLLTGDEVVEHGLPRPGEVRDTFGPQLPALVGMLGGHVDAVRRVGDVLTEITGALGGEALDQLGIMQAAGDVVITTGGTGHSDADHLREALEQLGARILIDGIAMRPGHPTVLAKLPDGRYLVGLPGNPLAAMMALLTVARPLLAGLRGAPRPWLGQVTAGGHFDPLPGRSRLLPYQLHDGRAAAVAHVGSAMLRGLANADGVMIIPAQGAAPGDLLRTIPLPW